jgi:hypothetical protein
VSRAGRLAVGETLVHGRHRPKDLDLESGPQLTSLQHSREDAGPRHDALAGEYRMAHGLVTFLPICVIRTTLLTRRCADAERGGPIPDHQVLGEGAGAT